MPFPRKPREANLAPLTDRERHVMDYVRKFLSMNDQLPTAKNIAQAFGWASANAACEVLLCLESKGQLARNELDNLMIARPVPRLQLFDHMPREARVNATEQPL